MIRNFDDLDVQLRIPLNGQSGNALTVSPDGRYVALQLESRLAVFDTTTGERLHYGATAGTDYVMSADWSERSDHVATSGTDGNVRVWDAKTGEQKLKLEHPHKKGCYVAISPDGQTIVTSDLQYAGDHGEDTIRVYDATGKQLRTFNPGDARANVLVFSPDGTKLLTGFFSQPPAIWDID